jgi:hypothetical protein
MLTWNWSAQYRLRFVLAATDDCVVQDKSAGVPIGSWNSCGIAGIYQHESHDMKADCRQKFGTAGPQQGPLQHCCCQHHDQPSATDTLQFARMTAAATPKRKLHGPSMLQHTYCAPVPYSHAHADPCRVCLHPAPMHQHQRGAHSHRRRPSAALTALTRRRRCSSTSLRPSVRDPSAS